MGRLRILGVAFGALALLACGDDGKVVEADTTAPIDLDTVTQPDDGGFVPVTDTVADPGADPGGDTTTEPPEDIYVPEPGEFGYPCSSNADCFSGFCIGTKQGQVCTRTCDEQCPDGWVCRQKVQGDPIFLCLPRWLHLCDPCNVAADCTSSTTDLGHYCIDWGEKGKFCGGECKSDGACPSGYTCKDVPIGGGVIEKQCVPDSQECSCSPLAVTLQLQTTCTIANASGVCTGTRACSANGLSACDAPSPEAEKCNGLDDNCNGATDDLPPDYQCFKTNEFGACPGKGTCIGGTEVCTGPSAAPEGCNGLDDDCDGVTDNGFLDTDQDQKADCIDEDDDNDGIPDTSDNCPLAANPGQADNDGDTKGDACDPDDDNDGVPDENDCAPLDATIKPGSLELCDGIDNNCDGATDENLCDDGNPCTDDKCQGTECVHTNNQKPCDDGTVCTANDFCQDGVCVGKTPTDCDDGNQCTNDSCDPVIGCVNKIKTGPCEDGSPCTIGETCQNGQCKGGDFDQSICDDGNPCTIDKCNAVTGCTHGPNSGGSCVTSSSDCPVGVCSGTSCIAKSNETCETEVKLDPLGICKADVAGVCSSAGKCLADASSLPTCSCSGGCSSVCTCVCGFPICLDFLFTP